MTGERPQAGGTTFIVVAAGQALTGKDRAEARGYRQHSRKVTVARFSLLAKELSTLSHRERSSVWPAKPKE